jgi:hypothetical protein
LNEIRRGGPRVRPGSLILIFALLTLAPQAHAQQRIRRSQEAFVRQKIADTWVEIHYRRPDARGRDLFGALVPWGRPWTPGADTATAITISTDVQVEGHTLPRGSYSIWMIPDSTGPWTVIFSKATPVFHLPYPGPAQDQLRVQVTPSQGPPMESLIFYFPNVDGQDATLVMHWGTTGIPLRLRVE